jgi:hypothetical protein
LHYVARALLATGHSQFAQQLLAEAVTNFKSGGIYEDVDDGHPATTVGVLNYTDSATNALLAAQILGIHQTVH